MLIWFIPASTHVWTTPSFIPSHTYFLAFFSNKRTAIFARNNWHNMLRKKAKAVNGPTGGASSSSSDSSQAAA